MADGRGVERVDAVARRVVACFVPEPRIVEQRPARRLVEDYIGRIRDELGKIGADRVGVGGAGGTRISRHRAAVWIAGLMHQRRARDPAAVYIYQRIDVASFGIEPDECRSAVEAIFLAFVEQQTYGPRRWRR